ncbi:MAG: hypothetical protein PHY30_01370 [Candidatus Pacebacteria bacterium]|nr:hypothetical protein [Candidatus Paceibacterota bacterium]
MRLQFLYSKDREKEKLMDICDEYQWFVDRDFPIILPKFFVKIYRQNIKSKKLFVSNLDEELNKIYDRNNYLSKIKIVKTNWRKIEKEFFVILDNFNLKTKNKYYCCTSLYKPEGQFKYPDIINLRIANSRDIKGANEIIAHEIIHLAIYDKIKNSKLNYQQIEGIVDMFFTKTQLKDIFPKYNLQSIAIHDKKLFQKVINVFK